MNRRNFLYTTAGACAAAEAAAGAGSAKAAGALATSASPNASAQAIESCFMKILLRWWSSVWRPGHHQPFRHIVNMYMCKVGMNDLGASAEP